MEQFADLIGFSNTEINVTIDGQTGVTSGAYVSGNYLPVLGVGTLAGRSILPEDDAPGKAQVAVISYRYWNQRFGLDPSAVGKKITIDQKPVTIIGVLPQSFLGVTLGRECDVYLPLTFVAEADPEFRALSKTDKWWIEIIGRLRPGISDQEAESALTAATRGWVEDIGTTSAYTKLPQVHLFPGARGVERLRRYVEPKVYVLSGFVGLVLLIACVNLANLLLARGTTRRREMAIRLSIGAGKFRLIRQLLTESILLAGIAGLLGLIIAAPLSRVILQMVSGAQTPLLDLRLDARTLAFTFVLSLLTGALFGTLPALRSARVDLTPALKNSGTTAGLPRLRLGRSLVVAQVGLSLILLVGAGLYMRTLTALLTTDLGFVTEQLITFRADASRIGYKGNQLVDVYDRLRRAISAMPGVESVAMSNHGLITSSRRASTVLVPGYVGKPGEDRGTYVLLCSDSFLSTMRIPLIAGRDLSPSDTAESRKVIVVNESFVKKFFPSGANPLGQIVHFGDAKQPPLEIVGLARNARYETVRGDYPATAYQPYTQVVPGRMTYAVRTTLLLAAAGPAIRRAVSGIDSLIPVTELRTQQQVISRHLATERLFAILVSTLGIIAALLAAIGLYGVMAYTTTRRTAEIGIRMALGAEQRQVQWLILRDAVVMVILGLAIGVPAAFALTELVKNQLYGIKPNDAVSFVLAVALMIVVAGLAAWLPARRAARVDPIVALKYE